jgi:hypothetical protein
MDAVPMLHSVHSFANLFLTSSAGGILLSVPSSPEWKRPQRKNYR